MSYFARAVTAAGALNRQHLLGAGFFCFFLALFLLVPRDPKHATAKQLLLINKPFTWEPRLFARLRWAIFAREILELGYNKSEGKPYQLERGDANYVVLPTSSIPELNRLGVDVLNTRKHHSFSLLGHLTGMDVILKTSYHTRTLLSRVSPAMNDVTPPMAKRMTARLNRLLPQELGLWASIDPVDVLVQCISEGLALTLFGPPICDNPELIKVCHEHTKNVFTLAFCMRIVPYYLQPILVWLLPAKWRLVSGWKVWDRIVIPEVRRRQQEKDSDLSNRGDLISWMLRDAKTPIERDEHNLCHLSAAVIAGATYSTANIASEALVNLMENPTTLNELREEIKQKHTEIDGHVTTQQEKGQGIRTWWGQGDQSGKGLCGGDRDCVLWLM